MRSRLLVLAAQLAVVVLLVLGWQWVGISSRSANTFLGTPAGVWERLVTWIGDGSAFEHLGATFAVLLAGFLGGTLIGTALGALTGLSDFFRSLLQPFLIFVNGVPRVILQPFLVIALGFGFASKATLVVLVIFVLVALNVSTSLRDIDGTLVSNMRVLGASRAGVARHVYLPWLALDLIVTSRVTIGFAFQAVVVSEFVGTTSGLGFLIVRGQNTFDVESIWAALVLVVVLALVVDQVLGRLQTRASRWMPAQS